MMQENSRQVLIITKNPDLLEAVRVILKKQYEIISDEHWSEEKELQTGAGCIMVDLSALVTNPLNELREVVAGTKSPVIALIERSDIQIRREVMNRGIYDFIDVPLDPDRVTISVTKAVNFASSQKAKEDISPSDS